MNICTMAACGKKTVGRGFCSKHYTRVMKTGTPLRLQPEIGAPFEWLKAQIGYSGADCLPWPFGKTPNGYGRVNIPDRGRIVASNAMCELAHGKPPTPRHLAAHKCGNGSGGCVNPQHLRWATQSENLADRLVHGTDNRGSRHGLAKLVERDVRDIRRLLASNASQDFIASSFGVSQTTICRIKHGICWGWLT
jgi:hypothetical protein